MADVTRRSMLRGSLAATAIAGTAGAAVALTEDDELGRLFDAFRAPRRQHDTACDAYGEYEERWQAAGGGKDSGENDLFWKPVVSAIDVEDDALRDIVNYRPRALARSGAARTSSATRCR